MDLSELPSNPFVRHPWELARFRFFLRVLSRAGLTRRPVSVLDAGSGDAWFASSLRSAMPSGTELTCWDRGYAPGQLASLARTAPAGMRFVAERPKQRYDLVLLLDVLEHVADDRAFLAALCDENVQPNGHVLVSVPAWSFLFGRHDRSLSHLRRYSPTQCAGLLAQARLSIELRGGLFHSLLLPRALMRLRDSLSSPNEDALLAWEHGEVLRRLSQGALVVDNAVSYYCATMHLELPGLSWWALCRTQS